MRRREPLRTDSRVHSANRNQLIAYLLAPLQIAVFLSLLSASCPCVGSYGTTHIHHTHRLLGTLAARVRGRDMLAHMFNWGAFNQIYATCFTPEHLPRAPFGANGLALDAEVESECWAFVRK